MISFPENKIVLVTGANGQLGQEFRYYASTQQEFEFVFAASENLDITNREQVIRVFSKFRPDYCINCAAYTQVDHAEDEESHAFAVNRDGVANLIQASEKFNIKFIHFSTDYVYHSVEDQAITEETPCMPKSVYARSKREGEIELEQSDISWINLRVSWLYSSFGKNFVKTMLRLGETKESLSVVSDQIGAPTYARDVVNAAIRMIKSADEGNWKKHYNFCNRGRTNWAEFAKKIFAFADLDCQVIEISTKEYGAKAARPLWSVMDTSRFSNAFEYEIPNWEDSLLDCLKELGYSGSTS